MIEGEKVKHFVRFEPTATWSTFTAEHILLPTNRVFIYLGLERLPTYKKAQLSLVLKREMLQMVHFVLSYHEKQVNTFPEIPS